MEFKCLTSTDEENIELGLRLVVAMAWEHMIKASQQRDSPNQQYCNRKYAEACATYEKITGRKPTA